MTSDNHQLDDIERTREQLRESMASAHELALKAARLLRRHRPSRLGDPLKLD